MGVFNPEKVRLKFDSFLFMLFKLLLPPYF